MLKNNRKAKEKDVQSTKTSANILNCDLASMEQNRKTLKAYASTDSNAFSQINLTNYQDEWQTSSFLKLKKEEKCTLALS